MLNVRKLIALLFCASLAAGLTSTVWAAQPCKPAFLNVEPPEVQSGKTSVVALLGNCMPSDLTVGFQSDAQGSIKIKGISYTSDKIVMSLDVPAAKQVTRRKLSVGIGGKIMPQEIYLKVVPPGMPAWKDVQYVTGPTFLVALRKVEAKADRAIGLAEQAGATATAAQQSVNDLAAAFKQYTESNDPDGSQAKLLIDGLTKHMVAIKQLQQGAEGTNSRLSSVATQQQQDNEDVNKRIDNIVKMIKELGSGVVHSTVQQ